MLLKIEHSSAIKRDYCLFFALGKLLYSLKIPIAAQTR